MEGEGRRRKSLRRPREDHPVNSVSAPTARGRKALKHPREDHLVNSASPATTRGRKALKHPREDHLVNSPSSPPIGTKHPISEDHLNSTSTTAALAVISGTKHPISEDHPNSASATAASSGTKHPISEDHPNSASATAASSGTRYPMVDFMPWEHIRDLLLEPSAAPPFFKNILKPKVAMIEPENVPEEGFWYEYGEMVVSKKRHDTIKVDVLPPHPKALLAYELLMRKEPGQPFPSANDPRVLRPLEEWCEDMRERARYLYGSGTKEA